MGNRVIEKIGTRYGRLTVIADMGNDKGGAKWKCKCDCGKEVVVNGKNLRSGNTKSCGCLQRDIARVSCSATGKLSALPLGQANFNALYRSYKHNAKTRNLSFELTKEDFSFLTKMNCFYCGCEPAQVQHWGGWNGDYVYNGIDRLDSNKGYTMDNVVPCCGMCNKMKWDETLPEFKQQILKIVKHRNWMEEGGNEDHTNF